MEIKKCIYIVFWNFGLYKKGQVGQLQNGYVESFISQKDYTSTDFAQHTILDITKFNPLDIWK